MSQEPIADDTVHTLTSMTSSFISRPPPAGVPPQVMVVTGSPGLELALPFGKASKLLFGGDSNPVFGGMSFRHPGATAMHHALTISEIVQEIFSPSPTSTTLLEGWAFTFGTNQAALSHLIRRILSEEEWIRFEGMVRVMATLSCTLRDIYFPTSRLWYGTLSIMMQPGKTVLPVEHPPFKFARFSADQVVDSATSHNPFRGRKVILGVLGLSTPTHRKPAQPQPTKPTPATKPAPPHPQHLRRAHGLHVPRPPANVPRAAKARSESRTTPRDTQQVLGRNARPGWKSQDAGGVFDLSNDPSVLYYLIPTPNSPLAVRVWSGNMENHGHFCLDFVGAPAAHTLLNAPAFTPQSTPWPPRHRTRRPGTTPNTSTTPLRVAETRAPAHHIQGAP
ncbi:hypothetical protein BJ138DRAFT_1180899 [Hygrophoropsis aurantiaca]|uniref:Uncharacterized protein n=1 Tax=Hygrophoropsis aurantiaca TaxID=72124 RepID=A0ACB8A8T7_9AGAM|nr:hypothetical protein BJ138DRAFT_1180899 [Hygrophoropsis aurantiaca]